MVEHALEFVVLIQWILVSLVLLGTMLVLALQAEHRRTRLPLKASRVVLAPFPVMLNWRRFMIPMVEVHQLAPSRSRSSQLLLYRDQLPG